MSQPMNSWNGDKADKERDGEHRERYLCAVCSSDSPARLHRHPAKVWVRAFAGKVWFHIVVVFVLIMSLLRQNVFSVWRRCVMQTWVAAIIRNMSRVSQGSVFLWVFLIICFVSGCVRVNPGVGPTLVPVVEDRPYLSRALTASRLEWFPMNSCTPWALCTSSLALTGTTMSPSCGQTFGGVISKGREGGWHWGVRSPPTVN